MKARSQGSTGLFLMLLSLPQLVVGDAFFSDEAETSGLDFEHFNGMTGDLHLPEVMGAGGALVDYDNDGDLDVYLVQGKLLDKKKKIADAIFPPPPGELRDKLFRNDTSNSDNGTPVIKFTDVTDASGLNATGYGMGVAVGDINDDKLADFYVLNFGPNELWVSQGDGTYENMTAQAAVMEDRWSVSASFADVDKDGVLDLYVGNYVMYDLENPRPCRNSTSARDYCGPQVFEPEPDRLFRNLGGTKFQDISVSAGITKVYGGALGVIAADFDGDNWVDIYVANDGVANQLWINQKDVRFVDEAPLAGVAVNRYGMPEASMGVDAADFDGDGDADIFMTHLIRETNTLYVNDGRGWFDDKTAETGLGVPSVPFTGFGTAWLDYDNDGWLDLVIVNGGVTLFESKARSSEVYPLDRRNQLFRNIGGRFEDVSNEAGTAFAMSEVSRGVAAGDIDNDGDTDLLITNNSGPARLLINRVGNEAVWLGISVSDQHGHGPVAGARLALLRENGEPLYRAVRTDGSYGSAGDARVLFGLGDDDKPGTVRVFWPDDSVEEWQGLETRRYHELRQGTGKKVSTE